MKTGAVILHSKIFKSLINESLRYLKVENIYFYKRRLISECVGFLFLKRANNCCQVNLDLGVQKKMIGYIVGNIYCTFCTDLMFL